MVPERQGYGWHGFLLPLGAVAGLAAVVLGLVFLADQQASANVAALFYDLIGDPAEATALRAGGGDRFLAKLIIMVVALVVGVGGIWLIYTGLNVIVERLGARWSGRLLPWVFVGPALLLLTLSSSSGRPSRRCS